MSAARRGGVVCLSATPTGRAVAQRLPYPHRHGDVAGHVARLWHQVDGFVIVLAVGATVRIVAPLLADKATDPCVVSVDDAGRYAVAVAGGHAGGANALATAVAGYLGAEPVITTATDRLGVAALDQLPGLRAEGDVAAVTSRLLAGEPVALDDRLGWPLPDALRSLAAADDGAGPSREGRPAARVVVSDEVEPDEVEPDEVEPGEGLGRSPDRRRRPVVRLRPPSLVVGVGTSSHATPDDLRAAVAATLADAGLAPSSVGQIATIDRRLGHPAVTALAEGFGVGVAAYPPAQLDAVVVPAPSEVVRRAVGTASVAEAAALLAAGPGSRLVTGKQVHDRATVAVARRAGPVGRVAVVGLGPGSPEHRTPAAERAVRQAEVVIGFSAYVEQCRDLLVAAQEVIALPLGAEVERATRAIEAAAAGRRVALVCSGDAGIYAMASPLLELEASAGVTVEVVPGVTAGVAAAALLGAPLGHDHALVSLSDLHTPWERIAERLSAAAAADYVVVLYNPRSARRTWQLEEARRILLAHRPASTPVGVVTTAGRDGQRVTHTTLGEMAAEEVSMTTCVIIGARATRRVGGRMVTPRGYFE